MIFLDTGYFLALFNRRDALHQRAIAWSIGIRETWIVTEYVLVECFNAFSRVEDRNAAHAILDFVMTEPNCEVVPASQPLFKAGVEIHRERADKEWSLTDCISFLVMRERNITRALAHDIHFEQAGFEALLRREP